MNRDFIFADWPAPPHVHALMTTRAGGVSRNAYASLNLGAHVGDDPAAVVENRRRLAHELKLRNGPAWLKQVHGTRVVELPLSPEIEADACFTRKPAVVCAVMSADCLPVLLCDDPGSVVAAAHAGWRGLAAGVLEETVRALPVRAETLMAWLGAAIGPAAFEVGAEVRDAFVRANPAAVDAFDVNASGKFMADLYRLARQRLQSAGVNRIYGGGLCTYCDATRFFSHRRDQTTGRMASLIWRD